MDERISSPGGPRGPIAVVLGILFLTTSVSGVGAQQAGPPDPSESTLRLGLDEAVARAIRQNEQVSMARAERARLEGVATEVRSRSLPNVSLNANYTRNLQTPVLFFNTPEGVQQIQIGSDNDYTFGVSLEQPVLDLSLGPARTAAVLSRASSDAGVDAARNQVAMNTRVAYYTVLRDRALLRVQEQALAQARRRLEQVRGFHRAGTASNFDLLTAEVEVENIRPDLIRARNRLNTDRDRLKQQIGVPLDRSVEVTDSLGGLRETPSLDQALASAEESRADLEGQQLQVRLQEQQVAVENRSALPTLSLLASFQRRASSDQVTPPTRDFSQSASAGFSISLPIFDGRARAGRVQQAEAAAERERFRLRDVRENVRLEVQEAHRTIESARQQIQTSRANVDRAEEALRIAQRRFENGLTSQVELNDAELAVTRARTNHAEALFQFHVARAQLQRAMGQR